MTKMWRLLFWHLTSFFVVVAYLLTQSHAITIMFSESKFHSQKDKLKIQNESKWWFNFFAGLKKAMDITYTENKIYFLFLTYYNIVIHGFNYYFLGLKLVFFSRYIVEIFNTMHWRRLQMYEYYYWHFNWHYFVSKK